MRFVPAITALLLLVSCAAAQGECTSRTRAEWPRAQKQTAPAPAPETAVDSLVAGKAWKVAKIDSSLIQKPEEAAEEGKKSAELYALQFETVGDFDAAQKRRWALAARTGYGLYLVFDSPFYKIRGGSFPTKEKAEQAVRDLQDASGVTALVIRVR